MTTGMWNRLGLGAVLSTAGCGVTTLDGDMGGGGGGGVPPAVQEVFDMNCATPGCHSGTTAPDLRAGASGSIIGGSSGQSPLPLVTLGDVENSYLLIKVTGGPGLVGGIMPVGGMLSDEDKLTLYGWVAGAPVAGGDEGTGGDTGTGDTLGDDTMGTTTGGMLGYEDYSDIQAIWDANCSGAACHIGGPTSPDLSPGVSYDNIVGVNSAAHGPLIDPGNPDQSAIVQRMVNNPNFGSQIMPVGAPGPIPELEVIEQWVADGAPEGPMMGGDDNADGGSDDGMMGGSEGTDGGDGGGGEYDAIQAIWDANCEGGICHINGSSPPDLSPGVSYDNIVDVAAAGGVPLISPNDPENSWIWVRMTNTAPSTSFMPLGASAAIPETADVEAWINAGAPR